MRAHLGSLAPIFIPWFPRFRGSQAAPIRKLTPEIGEVTIWWEDCTSESGLGMFHLLRGAGSGRMSCWGQHPLNHLDQLVCRKLAQVACCRPAQPCIRAAPFAWFLNWGQGMTCLFY